MTGRQTSSIHAESSDEAQGWSKIFMNSYSIIVFSSKLPVLESPLKLECHSPAQAAETPISWFLARVPDLDLVLDQMRSIWKRRSYDCLYAPGWEKEDPRDTRLDTDGWDAPLPDLGDLVGCHSLKGLILLGKDAANETSNSTRGVGELFLIMERNSFCCNRGDVSLRIAIPCLK